MAHSHKSQACPDLYPCSPVAISTYPHFQGILLLCRMYLRPSLSTPLSRWITVSTPRQSGTYLFTSKQQQRFTTYAATQLPNSSTDEDKARASIYKTLVIVTHGQAGKP